MFSRNVLLNSGMAAKIADLGVARIMPRMRAAATMTKAPGASVYMPPEALEDKPEQDEEEDGKTSTYDASIDVFSFGVVSIFTLSQAFPCKLLAPNYREGRTHIARTELERRRHYIKIIYSQLREQHPLLQMIERCLDFPEDRPSIGEVLHLLEEARAEDRDEQTEMNKLELLQALQTQPRIHILEQDLQSRVQEVAELQQQLQSSEREKEAIQQHLVRRESELYTAEETIRREQQEKKQMEELVQVRERELAQAQQQLREKEEQLQSSEPLVTDLHKHLEQTYSVLEPQGAKENAQENAPAPSNNSTNSVPEQVQQPALQATHNPKLQKLTVECNLMKTAPPCRMTRGSATTDNHVLYFAPYDSQSVYSYALSTEKWEELPKCPARNFGLVVIQGELTAVGGADKVSFCSNKLLTFQQMRWVRKYPPMIIKRAYCATVNTASSNGEHFIIVIGGSVAAHRMTAAVELFQVSTRKWFGVADMLQPLPKPSATICGNQLYVIGEDANGCSCSLEALLSNKTPESPNSTLHLISWTMLPHLPVLDTVAATLSGELVILGGWQAGSPVNSIHQLMAGQWVKIGSTFFARWRSLVANSSPDEIIIVSGRGAHDSVEKCVGSYIYMLFD